MLKNVNLILASGSPRRAELLRSAGIDFTVRVSDVDEKVLAGELPRDYVVRLSREKAQAVAAEGELVLGADTTVVMLNEILGKPANENDARRMLRLLSGKWHEVLTGVSLVNGVKVTSDVAVTRVKFSKLSEEETNWYVTSGEPMDKAGAYGIQGYAARFVERIEGSYSNVVGLPVQMIYRMLVESGVGSRESELRSQGAGSQ